MKVATARTLIDVAIAALVIGQVASWLNVLFGTVPSLIGAVVVLLVQIVCSRLAGANVKHYLYLYIPTVLFTVIPVAFQVHRFLKHQGEPFLVRLWGAMPLLINFVVPVVLLLIVRVGLGSRETPRDT